MDNEKLYGRKLPSSAMADASSTVSIPDLSAGFDDAADGWVEGSGTCCHSEGVDLLKEN